MSNERDARYSLALGYPNFPILVLCYNHTMYKVQSKRTNCSRISRRTPGKTDRGKAEISNRERTQLAKASRTHDWLRNPEEDIYTVNDGKAATWAMTHTNEYRGGFLLLAGTVLSELAN